MTPTDFDRILQSAWPDWFFSRVLGSGAHGNVILARSRSGEEAAVKLLFIRPVGAADAGDDPLAACMIACCLTDDCAGALADCRREIALLSSLRDHPNIVTLQDCAVIESPGGHGFTVMIRMERLTPLRERLPLPAEEVSRMGRDICKALSYLESKNILHRDIKPDNIFIDTAGNYKLGDFGISRMTESGRLETTASRGTPMYMAPEMAQGLGCDTRTDLYSLGLVMYTLLNDGRGPFLPTTKHLLSSAERIEAQKRRLSGEKFPPARHASPEMTEILDKCCAFRPEDRYPDAAALFTALGGAPAAAPSSRRSRLPIIAAAAALAAMLIGAAVLQFYPVSANENETADSQIEPAPTETAESTSAPAQNPSLEKYIPPLSADDAIIWNDAALEEYIRTFLAKPDGPIYPEDVDHITKLILQDLQISDCSALAHFTALTELHLDRNVLTDITPLSALTNLKILSIASNYVTDITPLAPLVKMERLNIRDNRVTDLAPLEALVGLRVLDFLNNQITDLTPLTGMTKLENLKIAGNQITDISIIRVMPKLRVLDIRYNQIEDFSPLVSLHADCLLSLYGNPAQDLSPAAHVKQIVNGAP